MVFSLELPRLGRPVVVPLLHLLCLDEVLLGNGYDLVDPLPHLTHVFHGGAVYCRLLFPGLSGNVKQIAGLLAEEQLEQCKACGGLRDLSDTKEHIG